MLIQGFTFTAVHVILRVQTVRSFYLALALSAEEHHFLFQHSGVCCVVYLRSNLIKKTSYFIVESSHASSEALSVYSLANLYSLTVSLGFASLA